MPERSGKCLDQNWKPNNWPTESTLGYSSGQGLDTLFVKSQDTDVWICNSQGGDKATAKEAACPKRQRWNLVRTDSAMILNIFGDEVRTRSALLWFILTSPSFFPHFLGISNKLPLPWRTRRYCSTQLNSSQARSMFSRKMTSFKGVQQYLQRIYCMSLVRDATSLVIALMCSKLPVWYVEYCWIRLDFQIF